MRHFVGFYSISLVTFDGDGHRGRYSRKVTGRKKHESKRKKPNEIFEIQTLNLMYVHLFFEIFSHRLFLLYEKAFKLIEQL